MDAAKQTIAQVIAKAPPRESLWHFLSELPNTLEAQIAVALVIAGLIGMLASWLVKWARGHAGPLWVYLFTDQLRYTVLSAIAYAGIASGAIASGIFTTSGGEFVGWANVLWFGITNAFGVDTAANKSTRQVWADEKRISKLAFADPEATLDPKPQPGGKP